MENKYLYYLSKLREVFIWSEYEELFVARADRILKAAQLDNDFPGVYLDALKFDYATFCEEYHYLKYGNPEGAYSF